MFEDPGAGPMVAEPDRFLLEAKFAIPEPFPGGVSRADLIEAARASERRVIAVSAPAGYGKSTLLAQWARTEERRVAWVSLDRLDDDPAALLTLLATAYARSSSSNADLVTDMGGGLGVSALGRAAPRLASAFRTSPSPFVLMLDDLHELRSPDCHDVLGVVVAGIPRGSQVVAASRSEQPYVPQLRVAGDAWEIGATDLAFDATGAEQVFSEALVDLTREQAVVVTDRTEGWPAGIYLAALIARHNDGAASSVSGDDRYVADYLYRESLLHLSEDTQRFLRRTAVLDQLCGPLCDALLGGAGASGQLRDLEASNMFLIPLDRRREWYRYHALFREFLLAELDRVEPDVVMKLHLRAADWYESHGSSVTALEHLLHTTERDRSVRLMTALTLPTYQAGQISTVQRWLSTVGDEAIEAYPPLAVLAGWMAALSGQTADAQRWAAIIDAASYDLTPEDGTASFDSARAMLRSIMCPAGPQQAMTDATLAVTEEPPWSPWRDQALCLSAEAHLLVGEVEHAVALFAESSAVAATTGISDATIVSESELALVTMDRGRWAEAADHEERALWAIEETRMPDYATSVLAFAGAARLAVHEGDLEEANRRLTQAMRARPSLTFAIPYLAVRVRLHLAKVYFAMGDAGTARHLLREIDDIVRLRPALGALAEEVSEFRRLVASDAQVEGTGGPPLTSAELRLLPYLQTHLTLREIGERLFVSRNTVNSEVSSIYRKLGVSSRGAAVEQATTIGLLGA
jgi:LuxR family transcriptional regulator, maltose regulon positive regulatory protein